MSNSTQARIARELGIDRQLVRGGEAAEIARRVAFIQQVLRESGCSTLVLGISGGVDSLTAGRLCQLAVEQMRAAVQEARFIAMRLPYRQQADESDAQACLDFIGPDAVSTCNIADSVEGLMNQVRIDGLQPSPALTDFVKGNVKARARMLAQYAVANFSNGLVVGTDHGAEALMGFFTKYGDGACDLAPLSGLTKTQVRLLAEALGAPRHLVYKAPTADLEELAPGKLDETAYGCSYAEIDAYLMGQPVPDSVRQLIESAYRRTSHKRALPRSPA
ncbi:ammonia-dependent NAD(+) synthetase [Pseudomonas protegens]|uniref:NH(3)-dependent NAD(+) synthetase n=1 Tax=Pseudomonas protegens (strain DSM 19095 / LMG 27888 / CFBP 6595 / CHA0) TaxID=1124983 RepID=A0A2C9EL26_PSEPH|nr:ammonia-dependent NAD(+) synthetase [Pseudomonas protegens]AGL84299.1 NH(3)-dependent NAD(+) synthetase NadE [Pseudomonas protegens CHA0]MBP5113386.1 ammonia-dependent NAD(+) synthetase [Pseudomonas protegens]QTU24254.1 ammonia-dependent NAD(+) synthetase [Pseudomonas protegens]QTU33785.1 ammonia-dependent NAD(+) synthetase [Pseudomonas protegens]RLO24301.1 ammonia-dependent NAD(+) synthetase [Pseudomonas protegens]